MPDADQTTRKPQSCKDLFLAFTGMALQGFGGVMPIIQRELVERRQWFTALEYVEMSSVARVLPGPNVVNLALMVGDRFLGLRGALSALAGMMLVPLIMVLSAAALYAQHAQHPLVTQAVRGMAAASAGLVIGSALKLIPALRGNPLGGGWSCAIAVASFVMVIAWHVPLWWVLLGPGALGAALTWWKLSKP